MLYEAFERRLGARRGARGSADAARDRAPARGDGARRVVVLLLGVWLMDLLVPAYDPGTHITYAGSPFTHIAHMLYYAGA